MTNIENSNYECNMCKIGSGHCLGDDNNCTCSCRIITAKKIVQEYLFKDVSNIKREFQAEFRIDPKSFIEGVLNEFYSKQNFENNKVMYEELFVFLQRYTEGDNLNTRESRTRLS